MNHSLSTSIQSTTVSSPSRQNTATSSKCNTYMCVVVILTGIGGLTAMGLGYFHVGAFSSVPEVNTAINLSTGAAGAVLCTMGVAGLIKSLKPTTTDRRDAGTPGLSTSSAPKKPSGTPNSGPSPVPIEPFLFVNLPDTVQCVILAQLPVQNLLTCQFVSRDMRNLVLNHFRKPICIFKALNGRTTQLNDSLLSTISKQQVKFNFLKEAKDTVSKIKNELQKIELLLAIAKKEPSEQEAYETFKTAKTLAEQIAIEKVYTRAQASLLMTQFAVTLGLIEEALEIGRKIPDFYLVAKALLCVAQKEHYTNKRNDLLREAKSAADKMDLAQPKMRYKYAKILLALARFNIIDITEAKKALVGGDSSIAQLLAKIAFEEAKAKMSATAQLTASMIVDLRLQRETLFLIECEELKEAPSEIYSKYFDAWQKHKEEDIKSYISLCFKVVKLGYFEIAERMVFLIGSDPHNYSYLMTEIAIGIFKQEGESEKARVIANMISDPYYRTKALLAIGEDSQTIKNYLDSIDNVDHLVEVLLALGAREAAEEKESNARAIFDEAYDIAYKKMQGNPLLTTLLTIATAEKTAGLQIKEEHEHEIYRLVHSIKELDVRALRFVDLTFLM